MPISMERPCTLDELENTLDLFLMPDQIGKLEDSARHAFGWKPRHLTSTAPRLRLISMPDRRVMNSPADVPIIEMPPIDRVVAARSG